MDGFNLWIGMSADFQRELNQFVNGVGDPPESVPPTLFPAISNLDEVTQDFFRTTHDAGLVSKLFTEWVAGNGTRYRVWSFYFDKPVDGPQIHSDIDAMASVYPSDCLPMGAWRNDTGTEVGTPFWYPVPQSVMNFMPPGATEPTDVNLLFGQAPRDFGSFYV
jgi:hypothetical protein